MSEPEVLQRPSARTVSIRGPKFFRGGEARELIMFVFNYDGSTRDGPREATEADAVQHAKAYAAFLAADEVDEAAPGPLDKRSGLPTRLEPPPLRPLPELQRVSVSGDNPNPDGLREIGPYERRRNEAYAKGVRA